MKALIAFIVLALIVLTLIEINERIKAKRKEAPPSDTSPKGKEEECPTDHPDAEDCSGCGLMDICEKEEKKKTGS